MKTVYRQLISIPIIKPIKSSTQSIQLRSVHHQSISRTHQKPILFKPYDGHSSLYLHPTTGSVSFLSDFPSKLQSVTILGSFSKDGKSFETHEPFLELMHQTFSNAFQYDPHVLGIARSCQATGYLHVYGLYLFLNLMIINSKTKQKNYTKKWDLSWLTSALDYRSKTIYLIKKPSRWSRIRIDYIFILRQFSIRSTGSQDLST